jgi:ankyrin repeat protein
MLNMEQIIRGVQHLQLNQPRLNPSQDPGAHRIALMATNQLRNTIVNGDISNAAALLRQGVDISESFEYCGQTITLLHSAATLGNVEMVKLLLAYNSNINAATMETGTTPLHVAVIKDHPAVVRLLLECGADIECKMHQKLVPGQQPVSPAGAPDSVDGLHNYQKQVNIWTGFRPLHCAAVYNRPECARQLLDFGATVDSRTAHHLNTPLHLSTVFGNSDVSEVLLKYGADREAKDSSNFTVFKLGPSHNVQVPPRGWDPSLHSTAPPAAPYYCTRRT